MYIYVHTLIPLHTNILNTHLHNTPINARTHTHTHTHTQTHTPQRNVPFTEWFQLAPVQSYHKSLPLEDFLSQLAPEKWPPGNRTGYCYRALDPSSNDCEMKSGNPFGPFWDELGVDFDFSEFTGLGYDVNYDFVLKQWQTRSVNHSILQYTITYCSIEFQYSVTLATFLDFPTRLTQPKTV